MHSRGNSIQFLFMLCVFLSLDDLISIDDIIVNACSSVVVVCGGVIVSCAID